jgi:predicted metal-dependent HD superfamily phosphohydrolase
MNEFDLHTSWQNAWGSLVTSGDGAALRDQLFAAYAEPHRHYHATQHLRECLKALDSVQEQVSQAVDVAEVAVALWFHDAIYDVHRHDNEQRSADWARDALLQAGGDAATAQRVHALIMATQHQAEPSTEAARWLVDIDLGILGAPPERFAQYEAQIRAEYAHVPGIVFRWKRRQILRGFLDRPRLFNTDHFYRLLEQRARQNLSRVIQG